ncbi:MAG TPA: beta-ketoacyl-ACP synthase II [Actinomycetota bacterium]|nr:beta-ketoacyl-ACP synthase II [Actinomycetota bacterium]
MNGRRVVVTGIGPVTPIGTGVEAFWEAAVAGRNGIRRIQNFDPSGLPVQIAGEVPDFDPAEWMGAKEARRTDRVVHLAVAAAQLAWTDAGSPQVEPSRVGVVFSTGVGGLESLLRQHLVFLEKGPDRVSPFLVPQMMPNAAAGHIAMHFGFTGPNSCVTTACAAGAHGVGWAFRLVKLGLADVAIGGGSEAATLPLTVAGFAQAQALTRNPDPETASRPFDKHRDGFVLAEGACALVLEEAERARARGARIYAEVAGFGESADAYHITAPQPEGIGAIQATQACLEEAGEPPEAVGYINAHGTSTPLNDAAETRAIKKALGDHAYRVPVSSTKSMTGHMVGAAGAAEAAVAALVVARGVIPPTIHYETPDEECDLDYVPNVARPADVRLALSNAFGFGGHNAVLAFRRWEG